MDQQLKERLVGIIVLVLFAVIFIPMFFSEPIDLVSKEKTNLGEEILPKACCVTKSPT